jgi:hypothetical protein
MGHDEAVASQSVEKYLLGQLAAEERTRFEEHFFDCELCAEEVRTGILLMDNAAAEFLAPPATQSVTSHPIVAARKSWLDWFRFDWRQPAFALPAIALVAVAALWVADHTRLNRELASANDPQIVSTEQIGVVRGAASVPVDRSERAVVLSLDIDPDKDTSLNYSVEISSVGTPSAFLTVTHHTPGSSIEVLLPTARYKPGRYTFTIRGKDAAGPVVEQFERNIE